MRISLQIIIIIAVSCSEALARAGSLPTSTFEDGLGIFFLGGLGLILIPIVIILFPFLLIYSIVMSVLVFLKENKIKNLLAESAKKDSAWEIEKLKAQVENVFLKVQRAWLDRNFSDMKAYLSDRLLTRMSIEADTMRVANRVNGMGNIELSSIQISGMLDCVNDAEDALWVHFTGSMLDFVLDESTRDVVAGSESKTTSFSEIWKFVRVGNEWKADEINSNASDLDIMKLPGANAQGIGIPSATPA